MTEEFESRSHLICTARVLIPWGLNVIFLKKLNSAFLCYMHGE